MSNQANEKKGLDVSETEANMLKRTEPQYVFSYITRCINLINDGDKKIKKETVTNLHKFICLEQPSIKRELIQELLVSFNICKLCEFNKISSFYFFSVS